MSEIELSEQAFRLAQKPAELEVFLAAHPEVKVDLYKDADGSMSLRTDTFTIKSLHITL
jgi:hypothetical protein